MRKPVALGAPNEADDEINLTPMLDVVFIMLIFFIVTAAFIKEVGIDVNRPDAPPDAVPSDENILITIGEESGIWMGQRLIDPRAVRANIERMHAENPDALVVIKPDRRSLNKTLVQVMDASRAAGIYNISIAADSDTGGAR
ncbi:MAG TPA: biopolymer transporter ExbD [Woeseiaceae bacterium]|nr:biopolymer transporter ExbD [Woeseiaceae bacterium]